MPIAFAHLTRPEGLYVVKALKTMTYGYTNKVIDVQEI